MTSSYEDDTNNYSDPTQELKHINFTSLFYKRVLHGANALQRKLKTILFSIVFLTQCRGYEARTLIVWRQLWTSSKSEPAIKTKDLTLG